MRFLARHTGVLAGCVALLLLAACTDGGSDFGSEDGDAARPKPSGSVAPKPRWSAPEQGPERPAAGKPVRRGRGEDKPPASPQGAAGDLNGDGYDDFAAYATDRVHIVYGSRDGLDPRTRTTVRVKLPPPAVHTGAVRLIRTDLNDDGYPDVVADFRNADSRALVLWSGPRGVHRVSELPGQGVPRAGDFDGDGRADLFRLGSGPESAGTVRYGPFDADGEPARTQRLRQALPPDSRPRASTAGDFDGDGRTDLAVRMAWTDPDNEGDGDLSYRGMHYYRGGRGGLTHDAARSGDDVDRAHGTPADVDGDGADDVTEASFRAYDQELHVTTRLGDDPRGRTSELTGLPGLGEPGDDFAGTEGVAIGDVTGDGKPDLVVGADNANDGQGVIFLLRDLARPDRRRVQAVDLQSPGVPGSDERHARNRFAAVPPLLDVDGDGRLDVVATAAKLGGYWVLPGTPTGLDPTATRRITREQLR